MEQRCLKCFWLCLFRLKYFINTTVFEFVMKVIVNLKMHFFSQLNTIDYSSYQIERDENGWNKDV